MMRLKIQRRYENGEEGGLGTYAWTGIFRLDIPVVMGVTLVSTLVYLFVNLAVDLIYARLDPRIDYE